MTSIEWTERTLSLWDGCDKKDPACAYCYIDRTMPFRVAKRRFVRGSIPLRFHMQRLEQPRKRRKPTMYFINQLGDTFHEDVPSLMIDALFEMFRDCPQHTFQVLTKRTERMRDYMLERTEPAACTYAPWLPLPNVWLGTTIGTRPFVWRADVLRETPAAVRFISAEPLLAPLVPPRLPGADDLGVPFDRGRAWGDGHSDESLDLTGIDWLIVGGESAGPPYRRLVDQDGAPTARGLQRVRDLRDAAQWSGTAFFFKQWGGALPKSAGRVLDGRTWDEYPRTVERAGRVANGAAASLAEQPEVVA